MQKPPEKKQSKRKLLKLRQLPGFIKPMLATLIDRPFDHPDWLFETKWDGYRALAYVDKQVSLFSRNNNSFNALFPLIVQDLSKLSCQAVFDGEIVILDRKGRSNFQLMQNYQRTQQGAVFYYIFDLLHLNGKDLRDLPLIERKDILHKLLLNAPLEYTRYSDHISNNGTLFFQKAQEHNLEGIVAKHKQSRYSSVRSREWLKIKTEQRQEAIIVGFTAPQGSRRYFGALLLGAYNDKKQLIYIGHVGTGFTYKTLSQIYDQMAPLIQARCPLSKEIKKISVTWLKPTLVCEITFSEWTQEGIMRHPVFKGMRIDKRANQVKIEALLHQSPKSQ